MASEKQTETKQNQKKNKKLYIFVEIYKIAEDYRIGALTAHPMCILSHIQCIHQRPERDFNFVQCASSSFSYCFNAVVLQHVILVRKKNM